MRLLKFLFVAICTVSCFAQSITGSVYINEFMAGNVEYLENPDLPENYPDWIELYNKSDVEVNVSGLFLSDTKDNFTKWEIPLGVSIPSNGFLIIYCDNFTSLGKTHANFKLNATRGSVLLVDRDGRTLIDSISYGNSVFSDRWIEDGSYVRLKNIILGYTFDKSTRVYKNLMVYATATNLFTFTSYSGYDPEFLYNNNPEYLGVDYGKIPHPRSFVIGIKLGL